MEVDRDEFCNGHRVFSGAMFCPMCRRVWAELALEGRGFFEPRAVSCEPCNYRDDLHPVPGSILDNRSICGTAGIDTALLKALPEEILRHEFNLHLKAYSNG
jgi:hypothetical protein